MTRIISYHAVTFDTIQNSQNPNIFFTEKQFEIKDKKAIDKACKLLILIAITETHRGITETLNNYIHKTIIFVKMIPEFIVRNRKALLLPTGLLALFLLGVMKYADSHFSNREAPFGQASMQFAFTHTKMFHIVHSFDAHQLKWARYSALIGKLLFIFF